MTDEPSDRDAVFEGLIAASGVPVTDAERARLRTAFDTLETLAERVRDPMRDWRVKPMPSFAATPRPGQGDTQRDWGDGSEQ